MAFNLSGQKWGSGVQGTTGGIVSWSFAPAVWGQFYSFDAMLMGAFQTAVRAAFARWEGVTNIDFQEVSDSTNSNIRLGWDTIDGASGTVAEASYYYAGGSIALAEIRFDSAETWSLTPDGVGIYFMAVALHEIGHAIGLGHAPDSIMAPYVDPNVDDLMDDDITAVHILYGDTLPTSGTPGVDTFIGNDAPNTYYGGAGDDFIYGRGGNDVLVGGYGNDQIFGELGNDQLYGGGGNDFMGGGSGDDQIVTSYYFGTSQSGFSGVYGGDGNDVIVSNGVDQIFGEAGNDTIYANVIYGGYATVDGGAGNDVLAGSPGGDTLRGGDGSDYLFGWDGSDYLYGGADNDVIYGGLGTDRFEGGAGADVFQFTTDVERGVVEQIADFTAGQDHFGMSSSYQGAVYVQDTANGVFISVAINGGYWGALVYGTHDVAAVASSIWYF